MRIQNIIARTDPRRACRRLWRLATYGLARRIGIVQTLGIIAFAVALGVGTHIVVAGQIRDEAEARAVEIVTSQARLAGVQLADYRLEDLTIGLGDLRRIRDVEAAWVVDAGDLLLSDGDAGGALFATLEDPLAERARLARSPVVELDGAHVRAAAPVFLGGAEVGAVRVDLSLHRMHTQLEQLRYQTALVAGLFVVLGLTANVLILHRTRRGLQSLVDMTTRTATGDFTRHHVVRSNDEIQQLAIAFNRMLLRLKSSTVSRDHVSHILQSMSEALLVIDATGRVTMSNKAATRLFGYTEQRLGKTRLQTLICQEDSAGTDAVAKVIADSPFEARAVTKHEGQIPVLVSASEMEDGHSTVVLAQDLRVRRLAYFDSVTDLPNRLQFKQELSRAVIEARANATRVTVFFVDLDHFKLVNDSYGHDVGDRLLRSVAERLDEVLSDACVGRTQRVVPLLARLGGDEFTIMCKGIEQSADAAQIAERLQHALAAPFNLGEHQVMVGASIGIANYPDHGSEPEPLVQNADRAMYWAKERGGGYRFFEPVMDTAAREKLELENELRRAVATDALSLYYQPQVDIPSGRVVGVEALLRWHHPRLGAISPGTFIPIAEASGVIMQLDRWVFENACKQQRRWAQQGLGDLRIAINIGALSLQQEGFVKRTLETVAATQANINRIEIEVTESAAVVDLRTTIQQLSSLRAAGVQIAIDDFGTGYSSLSYLKQLPADRLKIDRAFLEEAHRNSTDRLLLKAIVEMAKAVGMETLAEGVETQEQLDFLMVLGCQEYQGFLMSPAIAAEDILPWMLEQDLTPAIKPVRLAPPSAKPAQQDADAGSLVPA